MFYQSKTNTAVLQLGLKRAGLYNGEIDGVYGEQTKEAVRKIQEMNFMNPTGEVDENVLNSIEPYLAGYRVHIVSSQDTLYNLAQEYNTTLKAIQTANPTLDENNLQVGSRVIIPITQNVTVTDMNYNSYLVGAIARGIGMRYPFVEVRPIAKSVWGNLIFLLKIGTGEKQIFINAEHHANEWITTPLVFKFVEDYAKARSEKGNIGGFNADELYSKVTLYAVAAVNPDGIDIVNDAVGGDMYEEVKKIAADYENVAFPNGWKANAAGTDLNLNYPAGWEQARKIKAQQGVDSPAPRDYVGAAPLDQPESIAMYNLTVFNNFLLTLSYHTQGAVIYWKYLDFEPENSREIGEKLAEASGYVLELTPSESGYAGYKDWFIQTYNRPGYTIEAGMGESPLPITEFDNIYKQNMPLMAQALEIVSKM